MHCTENNESAPDLRWAQFLKQVETVMLLKLWVEISEIKLESRCCSDCSDSDDDGVLVLVVCGRQREFCSAKDWWGPRVGKTRRVGRIDESEKQTSPPFLNRFECNKKLAHDTTCRWHSLKSSMLLHSVTISKKSADYP